MTLAEPVRDTTRAARLDAVVDRAIAERRIVGCVILVAENGAPAYRRTAGFRDREAGTLMTEDTIFRLASVTKPIVAATALAMIDAGKLSLDDVVTRWLPDFRPKLADGRAPDITIRHLLTHTAGFAYPSDLPRDPYRAAGVASGLDTPGVPMEENLRRLASVPLNFAPGSAWRYGLNIDVLGAALAAVHGGKLADAVAHYVTGPLGMTQSGFTVRDLDRLAVPYGDGATGAVRMGEPHVVGNDPASSTRFSPAAILDPNSFQSGGAGLAGTAGDFLKFLEAIRTGGILEPETLAAAKRNQVGSLEREAKDAGWRFGFLGAVLVDPRAARTPLHAGTVEWGGAWGHNWFIDPKAGFSVALFTNTAMEGCNGPFTLEIRDALYGRR